MMSYLESVLSPREAPSSSGGGISEDGKLSYGYSSLRGKRPFMEDFYEAKISGVDGELVGLFGVFDGHGGTRTAEYVKTHLFKNLTQHPQFRTDIKIAIAESYKKTDSDHLKEEEKVYRDRDAGSTASTAVLVGNTLTIANVGDSRAVLCREGAAVVVTTDHKPNRSDERQRIEEAGGFVMWDGTWRVGGVLAVSRAFGNRLLKTYVIADPYIEEAKVDGEVEFLIIASDGVWDVISNEEAVNMVHEIEDAEEAARALTDGAFRKGSADNITCVVIRFHHDHA